MLGGGRKYGRRHGRRSQGLAQLGKMTECGFCRQYAYEYGLYLVVVVAVVGGSWLLSSRKVVRMAG